MNAPIPSMGNHRGLGVICQDFLVGKTAAFRERVDHFLYASGSSSRRECPLALIWAEMAPEGITGACEVLRFSFFYA
jgi:hypothetical protein